MNDYERLTLRPVKATTPNVKTQRGTVTHNGTNVGYDNVPVTVKRRDGQRHYYVFVRLGVSAKSVVAGVVHVLGVGRWEIQTYGADSQPRTTVNGSGTTVEVSGYEERGTLAGSVETLVHSFLNEVEYATAQAAKTDEERAAEVKEREDRASAQALVRAFIETDKDERRERFEQFMVRNAKTDAMDLLMSTYDSMDL
jgi:hypothetical protein